MNILILSWRGPGHPSAGGAEQSTWQHATGWVKAGHEVTLLTAAFVGCQPKETKDGVNILRLGDQFIGVRLVAFFWYWFGKHPKIDLVVDEFHGIPFFTPVWVFKSKILAYIHEIAGPVWHLNPWPRPFNLIPAIIGKYGEPWMFRLLYKNIPFMTVSNSTKEDLQKFGVKNITVIHNGVTLPKKLPKLDKEKIFTVIYLSALAKDKGIEDAIKVFNLLKTQIKNIQFWVVGKG
ncbi:MAG: glycosyltransferase family 4 protein, partial [Candidatus Amesbacteria bacterium]|nr:glycosyltransferase family 4 protein [Candidatus Amesbacteria bacterium]